MARRWGGTQVKEPQPGCSTGSFLCPPTVRSTLLPPKENRKRHSGGRWLEGKGHSLTLNPARMLLLGSRKTQGAFLDWKGGTTHGARSYFILDGLPLSTRQAVLECATSRWGPWEKHMA